MEKNRNPRKKMDVHLFKKNFSPFLFVKKNNVNTYKTTQFHLNHLYFKRKKKLKNKKYNEIKKLKKKKIFKKIKW